MAKIKGKKAFTKVINDFTQKEFGVTAIFGKEFQALPSSKEIEFSLIEDEEMEELFIKDIEERFPDIHTTTFIWSLMHEIGHCMTDDYWDMDDEAYFVKAKAKLDEYFDNSVDMNVWYHCIGDEYVATRWAGRWMRGNSMKMKKFVKQFNKALKKFYEKNGIEA